MNGFVAASADAADLAEAIERVHDAGPGAAGGHRRWFDRNARRLSLDGSLETVLAAYRVG